MRAEIPSWRAVILYPLMGCSLFGAFWYNFFAGTGEYFYHAKREDSFVASISHSDAGATFDPSRMLALKDVYVEEGG
jgi:hypothetical protein